MKRQRRGLNMYNVLQDGKKKKKVSLHMHDTLKTNCENNLNKKEKKKTKDSNKKTTNKRFTGVRTHINGNR